MDVMKVVQNIQELCNSKGVKPTVAARESGAGKDLITNMKKRGTQPSIEKIRLLAEYLGCSVSDILGEKEKEPTIVSDDGLSDSEQQLIKLFRLIPSEDRGTVVGMIEGVLRHKGLLK